MTEQTKRKDLIGFALMAALVTWSLLAYAELGNYMAQGTLFAKLIDVYDPAQQKPVPRPFVSDFANTYNAAVLARRCLTEKINIYDIQVQAKSLEEVIAPIKPELPFYLQYPPYFFALVLPLGFLTINGAWIVWVGIGIPLAAWCVWLAGGNLEKSQRIKATILALCSFPAWISAELGQTSLLLLPALTVLTANLEQRPFLSGFSSALAMIKMQYYPIFGAMGLGVGRVKFFLGALVAGICLVGISCAVVGFDNTIRFPHALLEGETGTAVSGVAGESMQNLRGQLALLFGADSTAVRQIAAGAFVMVVLSMFWLWFKVYPKLKAAVPAEAFKLMVSLSILMALTSSLHTHTQDYILAAIPAVWLWDYARHSQMRSLQLADKAIVYFPAYSWLFFLLSPLFMLLRVQPFFLWAVALTVVSCMEILRLSAPASQRN